MQTDVAAGLEQRGILVSGYEVLDQVFDGSQRLAPPTIYRALAGLIERAGVHRLESLESLVAGRHEWRGHVPILSIREECGVLEEAVSPHVADELSRMAGRSGFSPARQGFGVRGPYARCGADEARA